ncbi:hypothetical protein ACO2Q8_00385 [Larkinella sp. VNQ87]|uniref:hypothetical protein n=1 Tax=Larkinella sp. VNQ87 TaxID=3400921 RepID=UPI003C038D14
MKTAFLLGLMLNTLCATEAHCAALLMKADSLPGASSGGFTRVRFQSAPSRIAFQPVLSLHGFSQSVRRVGVTHAEAGDVSIGMALGLDEKSLAVWANNELLEPGKDYIYLPEGNRVRILNQRVLASDGTLEIMYKAQRFRPHPRFAISTEPK